MDPIPRNAAARSIRAVVAEDVFAVEADGPDFSKSKSRRRRAWTDRLGQVGIAGSAF